MTSVTGDQIIRTIERLTDQPGAQRVIGSIATRPRRCSRRSGRPGTPRGYVRACTDRGRTDVRLPWIDKNPTQTTERPYS